jgi:plasmid stabilization system protein ParE
MKKYRVILHPDAETDIQSSFEWGCGAWGRKNAQAWVRQLYHTIKTQLSSVPLRCAPAPESEELDIPVRHLLVGRYRVLFIVEKRTVTILHIKGSYVAEVFGGEETE